MEITKEYFDSTVAGLATKDYIDERIEGLARMVQRGFEDITERLDVKEDVEELKTQMHEVRRDLNLA